MKRQCLVRGNKIFFYGKTAKKIKEAADMEKITTQEWFQKYLIKYIKELVHG